MPDGGFVATDPPEEEGSASKEGSLRSLAMGGTSTEGHIYYMGIIDFYTKYDLKKIAERRGKAALGADIDGYVHEP